MDSGIRSDRLAIAESPTKEEIALIQAGLRQFNLDETDGKFDYPGEEDPGLVIRLAVKNPGGGVVAGISTSSILGVMWLEVLWVAEAHRRRGIASWLILEAERIAHEKGCVGAGTWTFDWQGAEFYPQIGFHLNGVYDGYPLGITEHVLSKKLPSSPEIREAVARRAARNEQDGFSFVTEPTKDEMRVVGKGLSDYCVAHAGAEMENPGIVVQLVLRDDAGSTVGGFLASTTIRIMALEEIWIDARYRGQGYGKELVAEAERIARAHGCIAVQGCCLSFQSPGFFRRLGYESFGVVDAYMDGYSDDLLIKRL
ncbi:GNAT family N-acetyltransferase [Candidatus Bipolaricaulota bacterium]